MLDYQAQNRAAAAWGGAATAMADATLSLAMTATQSALSMWGCAMGLPGGRSAGTQAEPLSVSTFASGRPDPAPEAAASAVPRAAARSWYSAPYRSPFDPLFWLEWTRDPAGMTLMPWLTLAQGAAAAMPWRAPLMAAPATPFDLARLLSSGPMTAGQWSPMLPVLLWSLQSMQMAVSRPIVEAAASVGLEPVYSAYRTASGYASAPAVWVAPKPEEAREGSAMPWLLPFMPWLGR